MMSLGSFPVLHSTVHVQRTPRPGGVKRKSGKMRAWGYRASVGDSGAAAGASRSGASRRMISVWGWNAAHE